MSNPLPAAQLPAAITKLTGKKSPSYQTIYRALVSGQIPHERSFSNRLSACPEDLCKYFKLPIVNPDAV
jgi:hypothetical protein